MGGRFPASLVFPAAALSIVAGAGAQQAPPPRPVLLTIQSHVSAERVAAGDSFAVTLDLAPAPGIHVYAPTVVDYKPIAFTVRPQPGLIVRKVTYPQAEKYVYAPLKQTIDVYEKPFRVVQELALDASPAGRAALKGASMLTMTGTLSYQACDEKICYPPRAVQMTWTVALKES